MPMYFHSGTMVTLFFKEWMTMSQTGKTYFIITAMESKINTYIPL